MTNQRNKPRTKLINVKTTPVEICDSADLLYHYSQKIREGIAKNNMSSNFRDKLGRILDRLTKTAQSLGASMPCPDNDAFETSEKTRARLELEIEREQKAKSRF